MSEPLIQAEDDSSPIARLAERDGVTDPIRVRDRASSAVAP